MSTGTTAMCMTVILQHEVCNVCSLHARCKVDPRQRVAGDCIFGGLLVLQVPGNFTPFPQLTLVGPISISLSNEKGVNISQARGIIGGAAFDVSAFSAKGTGFEFR